ncbi:hypothetical protein [Curvivirga aplysinae]|uniref:hypothetical protein n=1 Tax=Curvivirga aplysinae TaxID=2529852 RepID=UPI0012BB8235|nr:hypothetical protein [Curvivirga aplysinae]MTI09245.1 hypothetical protein [Curvivirga aplysinae]
MSIKDKLHRARAYPYDSPRFSYLYHDGDIKDFDLSLTQDRTPVLAFGSNKAPSQLTRKFGHLADQMIPVEQVKLYDFDVVFAAHITSYGAMPAMLQHCPDVIVSVAITWLDETQLNIMHKSELYAANYSFAELNNIRIDREDHSSLNQIYAYIGERGHYCPAGNQSDAISISDVHAENRQWDNETTASLLSRLHQQLEIKESEEDFILRLVSNVAYRRGITARISRDETTFAYPYKIITSGDDLDKT